MEENISWCMGQDIIPKMHDKGFLMLPVLASPAIYPPWGDQHSGMIEHCLSEIGQTSDQYLVGGFCNFHLSIQKEIKSCVVKNRFCKLMMHLVCTCSQINLPKPSICTKNNTNKKTFHTKLLLVFFSSSFQSHNNILRYFLQFIKNV